MEQKKIKVRYIGDYYKVRLHKGKIYDAVPHETGSYYIEKEEIGDPGYFPPQLFEIVTPEEDKTEDK